MGPPTAQERTADGTRPCHDGFPEAEGGKAGEAGELRSPVCYNHLPRQAELVMSAGI
jgi:hypothetical protein